MAHWRSLGPNPKYLAAYQLEGKDVTVIIDKVVSEKVSGQDGKTDQCRVMYFKGAKLPFIVNVTNGTVCAKLYGNDTDGWLGKPITLYPTTIQDKRTRETIECIRMKAPPKGDPVAERTNLG